MGELLKKNLVKVKVSAAHIKYGNRNSNTECTIALAIKDVLKDSEVEVFNNRIYVNEKCYSVDETIYLFNQNEESGEKVEPFIFVLSLQN